MATAFVENLLVPNGGNFIRVAVRVWDPEPASATAICVHDFAGDSSDFSMLAMSLAKAGHKTVAMDLPGRGASAFTTDPQPYTLALMMACLAQMNRYRQGPVTFFGSGWGATMALLYLAQSHNPVSQIILHEPLLATGAALVEARDRLAAEADLVFETFDQARSHLLARRGNLDAVPEPLQASMIDAKIRQHASGFVLNFDSRLMADTRQQTEFDLEPLVACAGVPVLMVLGGSADSPFRDWIETATPRPHVRVTIDPDAGCRRPVLTRHQCDAVAQFLIEHTKSPV